MSAESTLAESLASSPEERLVIERQHCLKSVEVLCTNLKKIPVFSKSDCKTCEGIVIFNKYFYSSCDKRYLISITYLVESILFNNVPYLVKSGWS